MFSLNPHLKQGDFLVWTPCFLARGLTMSFKIVFMLISKPAGDQSGQKQTSQQNLFKVQTALQQVCALAADASVQSAHGKVCALFFLE